MNADGQTVSRVSSCLSCNTNALCSRCFEHDINHCYGLNDRDSIPCRATRSRHPLGPTHLPIQWIAVGLSLKIMRSEREPDHSLPFDNAEVMRHNGVVRM
jgi:hypothetical protein